MTGGRERIDPTNRYPAGGLLRVEALALMVLEYLPDAQLTRTRDAIQIEHGGEQGIVVLVTAEAVELRLPTVEWTCGAYGPAPSSRLWKRVRAEALFDGKLELGSLLTRARDARAREFRSCKYCRESVAIEHRHGNVCHGCAERYEGIVQ